MQIAALVASLAVVVALAEAGNVVQGTDCNLQCGKGEICLLKEVQCITTPCNPIATCVPVTAECTKPCSWDETCRFDAASNSQYCENLCTRVRCSGGFTCEVQQAIRIRAPRPATAVCKLSK